MFVLGLVLLVLGLVLSSHLLVVVGLVLLVLGAIFGFTKTGPFNGRWY